MKLGQKKVKQDKQFDKLFNKRTVNSTTTFNARDIDRITRINKRGAKAKQQAETAVNKAKQLDSKVQKLVNEMSIKGYLVDTKLIYRNGERGRTIAQLALAGPLGNAAINTVRIYQYRSHYSDGQTPFAVKGTKYKVRQK